MSKPNDENLPSNVLKHEHQLILRVIGVLDRLAAKARRGDGLEVAALRKCVEFIRFFADACHHAKEEDLLFPMMEERGIPRDGGPIGVMLQEHTQARGFTKEMNEALDAFDAGDTEAAESFIRAAYQYRDLLTHHIYKEDNILYPMGDRVMSDTDQQTLCGKFCDVGCQSFGGKKREELERLAEELEAAWPA